MRLSILYVFTSILDEHGVRMQQHLVEPRDAHVTAATIRQVCICPHTMCTGHVKLRLDRSLSYFAMLRLAGMLNDTPRTLQFIVQPNHASV